MSSRVFCIRKKRTKMGQADHMDRFIIFCVGALASMISEVFWKGQCHRSVVLWGGAGMLLLRRIVLRFPYANRALLCVCGALLLIVLRSAVLILHGVSQRNIRNNEYLWINHTPSFSYTLYRFLLIAPAYTVIEYLESCFDM